MLICSSASFSRTFARAPVRFSSPTARTSEIRYSVPREVRTFLVVSRSVVTNRRTLGPSVSITVMARMSTFSWASAEQIFASRPGLFSRWAVTSLTISIERSPRQGGCVDYKDGLKAGWRSSGSASATGPAYSPWPAETARSRRRSVGGWGLCCAWEVARRGCRCGLARRHARGIQGAGPGCLDCRSQKCAANGPHAQPAHNIGKRLAGDQADRRVVDHHGQCGGKHQGLELFGLG